MNGGTTEPGLLSRGSTFAGRFRVVRYLDGGGMGEVYEVEHLATGRSLALKVLRPAAVVVASVRARFAQEARVGARISSPHVVEVVDAGLDEEARPWLAMEFLQGRTLASALKGGAPSPHAVVALVFAQLGDALGAAHDKGVVHLDLKPENIFLAELGLRGVEGPVVKVLDFGIARLLAEGHTSTAVTTVLGSPLWMAPEQAEQGERVRAATDVWALGLIAYRMLTGRYYWPSGNAECPRLRQVLQDVLYAPLVPASARAREQGVAAHLPRDFDAWFTLCIQRDPATRFQSGRAAAEALRQVLAPWPAAARPLVSVDVAPPDVAPPDVAPPDVAPPSPLPSTVALPSGVVPSLLADDAARMTDDAITAGEALLARGPADPAQRRRLAAAYAERAAALASRGRPERAIVDAARSLDLDPSPGAVWALRAGCHLRLGRAGEALRDYASAAEREPAAADHWYGRALAHRALGQEPMARADLAQAAYLGHPDARRALGR